MLLFTMLSGRDLNSNRRSKMRTSQGSKLKSWGKGKVEVNKLEARSDSNLWYPVPDLKIPRASHTIMGNSMQSTFIRLVLHVMLSLSENHLVTCVLCIHAVLDDFQRRLPSRLLAFQEQLLHKEL